MQVEQTTCFFTSYDGPKSGQYGEFYLVNDAAGDRYLVDADLAPAVLEAVNSQSPLVCKIKTTQRGQYTNRTIQEIKDYNNAPERPSEAPGEASAPPVGGYPAPQQASPPPTANSKDEAMYVMSCNRLLQGVGWTPGEFSNFLQGGGLTELAKAATIAWRGRDPVNPPKKVPF